MSTKVSTVGLNHTSVLLSTGTPIQPVSTRLCLIETVAVAPRKLASPLNDSRRQRSVAYWRFVCWIHEKLAPTYEL